MSALGSFWALQLLKRKIHSYRCCSNLLTYISSNSFNLLYKKETVDCYISHHCLCRWIQLLFFLTTSIGWMWSVFQWMTALWMDRVPVAQPSVQWGQQSQETALPTPSYIAAVYYRSYNFQKFLKFLLLEPFSFFFFTGFTWFHQMKNEKICILLMPLDYYCRHIII